VPPPRSLGCSTCPPLSAPEGRIRHGGPHRNPTASGTSSPADADLVSAYSAKYGEFGTFGPPTYTATQVVLTAMNEACKAGKLDGKSVVDKLKTTNVSDSILGGTLKFDAKGDVEGGKFYIFRIQSGKYTLVTQ
jgi:ABC-type branched-subunit amino acid transport system substrate-binding protein